MAANTQPGKQEATFLEKCLSQFDDLRANGFLFYEDSPPEYIESEGFKFQLSLIKAFEKKPWPGRDGIKHPTHKPDPFGAPEPEMVVAELPGYVLQQNKYCAVRPQLLLHPKTFVPQKDRLTLEDFDALLKVRERLADGRVVAFYNCGPDAGSSQPYKHIQIFLKPAEDEFVMWPDRDEMVSKMKASERFDVLRPELGMGIPYLCRIADASSMDAAEIEALYQKMLESLRDALGQEVEAHNIILTMDWLCVIPRRESGDDGAPGANSMGMMGIVWLNHEGERIGWKEQGMARYFSRLGYEP